MSVYCLRYKEYVSAHFNSLLSSQNAYKDFFVINFYKYAICKHNIMARQNKNDIIHWISKLKMIIGNKWNRSGFQRPERIVIRNFNLARQQQRHLRWVKKVAKKNSMRRHKNEGLSISFFRGFLSRFSFHLPHFYDVTCCFLSDFLHVRTVFGDMQVFSLMSYAFPTPAN